MCRKKTPLHQHAEMLMWAPETTRTGPFILQKEGIKTAEQQSLIVLT